MTPLPLLTPRANDNFEDSEQLRRWTPTAIDIVSPFMSDPVPDPGEGDLTLVHGEDDLAIPHEPPLEPDPDPPTTFHRRLRFQALPPGTIVGESYEIIGGLGAGAMGEVYEARHTALEKRVAIKVIGQRLVEDDRAIGRFLTEARALAQIQHPAIVTVEHVGKLPDGRAYFVMEYLRGESLSRRLSRGRIPLPEALRILDQMARGLAAAHISGVIHRDLKPDNTFLAHRTGEKPAVKLLDFGLAKLATSHPANNSIDDEYSDCGVLFGTPLYMSPEQARGGHIDHRADIYALGCVAYELILGVRPFPQAQTTPAICVAHINEAPSSPRSIRPEIPLPLDLILSTMLAKDPAYRPSLAQIRSVIAGLRTTMPSQQAQQAQQAQRAATVIVRSAAPRSRVLRTMLMVLAAVSVVTAGGMLGFAISSKINDSSHSVPARSLSRSAIPRATAPTVTPEKI
jgi:serine/threonine-protein kinase